jgi:acyl carrier protein
MVARQDNEGTPLLPTRQIISVLENALNVTLPRDRVGPQTPLLGAIPEFDSMAVVSVLTALEQQFGIVIDDDEVDGSIFATIGSLAAFVERKLEQ